MNFVCLVKNNPKTNNRISNGYADMKDKANNDEMFDEIILSTKWPSGYF